MALSVTVPETATQESRQGRLTPRQGLGLILGLLLVTDVAILVNAPVLRPFLSLATFSILPGWLVLRAWRQRSLKFAEQILISVAISLAAMMLAAVFMSTVYPVFGVSKPYSELPVVLTFNVISVAFAALVFLRDRSAFAFARPRWQLTPLEKFLSLAPLGLLILSIAGTRIIDDTGNNLVLVAFILGTCGYLVLLAAVAHRAPNAAYVFILFVIGLAAIYLWTLRTQFVLGQDSVQEVWAFQKTVSTGHLNFSSPQIILSVVSVTGFPTLLHSLSGVGDYLFKAVFPLIFALVPPMVFMICSRYVSRPYAFMAAMFIVVQSRFFRVVEFRSEVATFFLAAALFTLFNPRLSPSVRRICALILLAAVVLSHYTSAYALAAVLIGAWVLSLIVRRRESTSLILTTSLVLLFAVVTLGWYGMVPSATPFEGGVGFVERVVRSLKDFYQMDTRSGIAQQFLGGGGVSESILRRLNVAMYQGSVVVIAVGLATALWREVRGSKTRTKAASEAPFEWEYLALATVGCFLLAAGTILPSFSNTYDMQRFFLLVLTLLAPFLIIGGQRLCGMLKAPGMTLVLPLVAVYFLFTSGLAYQAAGIQYSTILNTRGLEADRFIIRVQEDKAVNWLIVERDPALPVYADHVGIEERWSWRTDPPYSGDKYKLNPDKTVSSGYVYLRYVNVQFGTLRMVSGEDVPLSEFSPMLDKDDKIYASNGSEIYLALK